MRRFLAGLEAAHPQVTTVLEFDPGEAAQVDFGKGPEVLDPRTGELLSTWVFVMTLAWSRHAYAEVVTDQKVATWLGCHRRGARMRIRRSVPRAHWRHTVMSMPVRRNIIASGDSGSRGSRWAEQTGLGTGRVFEPVPDWRALRTDATG